MTDKKVFFWLKLSVTNFLLVAFLGVLMRYKIAYSLPFLDQKHTQEAHSHFAFYGWITQIIYVFLINYLQKLLPEEKIKKYVNLLITNLFSAYLMIPAFMYGGYFWLSIAVSTLCLLVGIFFFVYLLSDLKNIEDSSKNWFLAALFFASISSLGVFTLSYMMATKHINQDVYLASQYYYLHFQYNGFFIFSGIGFLMNMLEKSGVKVSKKENTIIFRTLFFGTLLGYGLSVLWLKLPIAIFFLIVLASISQTFGAAKLLLLVKNNWQKFSEKFIIVERCMFLFAAFAFFVKITLQLGSNIPAVNQFAFGFRNIVIAYLHLVLLMCVSVFFLLQILQSNVVNISKNVIFSLKMLLLGIFLNELLLGLMGIFSIKYIAIPYANESLLLISFLMFLAMTFLVINFKKLIK